MKTTHNRWRYWLLIAMIVWGLVAVGCAGSSDEAEPAEADTAVAATDEHEGEDDHDHEGEEEHAHDAEAEMLLLPELAAAALNGEPLRVVATTSIIGDVVAQVGGAGISLTILMGPGQDPHSFEPSARELTAVADAHVIFVNGWDLEEGLVDDLANIGEDALVAPISANIAPLAFAEGEHEDEVHDEGEAHEHSGADPHVWFAVHNVEQWAENVAHVLSDLDPANAEIFAANAAAYVEELEALEAYAEAQLAAIPANNRFLVTNHDSFGYFAQDYGFTVLGTVIPSLSSVAEPSASDLTDLIAVMQEHAVCTLFTETTLDDALAQTVAGELSGCDEVQVLKLYTGAIGPEGSGADSYIGMFRANVDAIVAGLQ
ncbi:MAG: zinc ABC transporter substrate-binding protein [Anaerolineaceae bacterium]|nr:zinc ABC transporter substrate-binding protein [Anaerolineaceae bacterium]